MFALVLTTLTGRGTTNPAPLVAHELHEHAVTHGAVRVLVRLNAPFVAAGAAERGAIAGLQSRIRQHLSRAHHRVIRDYGGRLPVMALEVSPDALQALGGLTDAVNAIHHDRPQRPALAQSVPLIRANSVWAATVNGLNIDGRGQIVVILDTGVQKDHPFFVSAGQTRVIAEACFSSTGSAPPSTSVCPGGVEESIGPGAASPCPTDVNGCYHGTLVAGIAAGNGTGVPGAPPGGVARGASIIAVQIFSRIDDPSECYPAASCARTFTSDQIAALEWIQSQRTAFAGLRIAAVNMSIGGGASPTPCDDDPSKPAIDMLRVPNAGDPTDAGVATVIAAGNAGMPDALSFPACISTAIPVVSTTKSDTISNFSNIGSPLAFPNQLLAPGSSINSSWPPGYSWYAPSLVSPPGLFTAFSGTSAAAPHVAGAIAVLRQASPMASVDDLIERLKRTGPAIVDPQNDSASNCLIGRCPRINVLAAAPPNLAVHTLTAPKAAVPGGTIDVSASLKNKLGFASASTLDLYFSSDSTITESDLLLGTIAFPSVSPGTATAPGISPLRTTRVTIPSATVPGDYFIGAIAGGGETPSQTDETDDTKAIPLKVVIPDLTVPSVTVVSSLSATPNGVAPGMNVTVTHRLRNISVAPANAPNSVSGIYLATGQDLASAVALLGTVTAPTVTALTTSGSITATNLTIPAGTPTGAYFVLVQANDDRAVTEMTTSNNVGATALPLLVGPDLTVTKATAAPLSVAPGASVAVTNTVRNAGGEATGPFDVGLYLSSDNVYDGGDQLLATRRVAPGLAPGAVSTAVTSVMLPNTLTAGPYFIIVRADITGAPPGEISEANESNNTLAGALTVVRADLLVQSVTATSSVRATPKAVAPGLPVTLTATIKNQAAAAGPASASALRLYLSTDTVLDVSDVQLGPDIDVPALAGGRVVTLSRVVTIPGGTLPGPYYVLAQVNATNTVFEADSPAQSNDVKATLTPLIVGPDLVVSAATASPTATAPGFTVAVNNTARNVGGEQTGPFDVGIYLSSDGVYDGGDQLLGTRRVTDVLAPGAASTAVTSVTLPNTLTAGSYFLIVRADISGAPPGEVSEAIETNNARAIALRVVRPDLLVQSVTATSSIAATPGAVAPGLPITVTTTIKNQAVAGGAAAPTVLRLYLSSDATLDVADQPLGADINVPTIAGGGVLTLSRVVPIPNTTLPGPYYVIAQVNATNTSLEADSPAQANDVKARLTPLTVGPDLVVSAGTASPAATAPGLTVAVTNTVRNAGGQPTGPFDVGIYLSSDGVYDGGDQLLGTRRVTDVLAPGAASTAVTSVTLPNTLTAGSYSLIVRADIGGAPPGEISEANESNNTRTIALRVVRADLLVQSVTATSSVAATPTAVAPGLPITVRTTIKNQAVAGGTAAPTVLRLYLSSDATLDVADTQLGDDIAVPALAGGGVVTLSRVVPIPDTTLIGPYYVIAKVNATNTTLEADSPAQGNDVKATLTPLTVGPDLVVTAATPSPRTAAAGATVAVTNTVRNAGGQATAPFDVAIYVSSNNVYDAGAQLLATRRVTAGLIAGAVSTAIISVTLPDTLTAGPYFVIVRADSAGEIGEANTSNNSRAVPITVR